MIIDFHCHAFPDFLASRAIPMLAEKAGLVAQFDGTVSGLADKMEQAGVARAVVLSIATKPTQEKSVNNFAISLAEDQRFIPFGSVYPGSDTALSELERIKHAGIRGIKLHPEYQSFQVDDPIAAPIYEACGRLGLIVLLHAGGDAGYAPPYHSDPQSIRETATRFPNTTFVAAHFGSYDMWDDVYQNLCGISNLYLDTSMCNTAKKIDRELARKIVDRHGVDKILFGTDMPWENYETAKALIQSLGLSQQEQSAVFSGNAIRLLGLA